MTLYRMKHQHEGPKPCHLCYLEMVGEAVYVELKPQGFTAHGEVTYVIVDDGGDE